MSIEKTNIISLEDHFGKSTGSPVGSGGINELPKCPDYLTEEAKAHWPELIASLSRHGIINEIDRDMLGMYCAQYAITVQLYKELTGPGGEFIQETKTGYKQESAPFTAYKSMLKSLMGYASKLGLTPSARTILKASAPGQEEFLF